MPQADQLALVLLNGITFGMLLFVLAAGLLLILGVMRIINLAHGSFYMLAGFIGLVVARTTGNFALGALAGMGAIGLLGLGMERFFLRRLPDHLAQILFTLGCVYIFSDLARAIWGRDPLWLAAPALLTGSVPIGDYQFPIYRLGVIFFGSMIAIGLWLFLEKTRFGAIIRAGVDDKEMVSGIGINIKLVFTAVFTLGALLAGLAGVMGAPILTASLTLDWLVLTLACVVIVVGGLRTLQGALLASILIGLVDSVGKFFFPELAMFLIFGAMALILALRPYGLVR